MMMHVDTQTYLHNPLHSKNINDRQKMVEFQVCNGTASLNKATEYCKNIRK
jgi:hypothetical protein